MGAGLSIFSTSQGTVAATDAWIVAGAGLAMERLGAAEEGAVQVFNAAGVWQREILPPLPIRAGHHFGNSVAINGNLLIVGAPDQNGPGKAYLYDLKTGKLVRNLFLSESLGVDRYGAAVASAGDWVAIGAPANSENRGTVYVLNLKTQSVAKFNGSQLATDRYFGASLAIEGEFLAVGAPGRDQFRGSGYVFDLSTLLEVGLYQPDSLQPSDQAGAAVALQGGRLLLGAPGTANNTGVIHMVELLADGANRRFFASDGTSGRYLGSRLAFNQGMILAGAPNDSKSSGAAYVFDVDSLESTEMRKLVNPQFHEGFAGFSVAWAGSTAVLAVPNDNDQFSKAGALILMRPVTKPAPMAKVAGRGDFAPGVPGAVFNKLGDAFVNRDGAPTFAATLAGPGSNGGRDMGVWTSQFSGPGRLTLSLKSRTDFLEKPVALLNQIFSPLPMYDVVLMRGTVTGPQIKSYENQGIYWDTGKPPRPLFRTGGDPSAVFGNGVPQTFHEVRVNRNSSSREMAVSYTLRSGVANTAADSDTGVSLYRLAAAGTPDNTRVREGLQIGATGLFHGQFATSRLAFYNRGAAYGGAIQGLPATNQGLFGKVFAAAEQLIAQKGDMPSVPGGIPFSSFIGETRDDAGRILFRATMGPSATTANNEGLWRDYDATKKLFFRKGQDLGSVHPTLNGVRIAKFIYYTMDYNALVLVQLTGSGVTSANDQAILLYDTGDFVTLLMREGDAAPGCDGARIGVISRIEREPYAGQYLVLASLAGAAPGTDQALFRGFSNRDADDPPYKCQRRPVLVLRKGWQYDSQPSRIKSLSFSNGVAASGAGSLGLGRAIQETESSSTAKTISIFTVEFANGVRQIMAGKL